MILRILQIAVPFIWFGLIGGISFLEAPLKFQAPNITIPLGLGIGRLVFFAVNKIEIILAVIMIFTFIKVVPKGKLPVISLGIVCLLLILETVWLLPALDVRAEQVINGNALPFSNLHIVYIIFDAAKFFLLFILGTHLLKQNLKLKNES